MGLNKKISVSETGNKKNLHPGIIRHSYSTAKIYTIISTTLNELATDIAIL